MARQDDPVADVSGPVGARRHLSTLVDRHVDVRSVLRLNPGMVGLTAAAGWALYALPVGPPGAFFFALSTGVANLAAAGGQSPGLVVGLAAVGALSALVIGTSDGWFRTHDVEEAPSPDAAPRQRVT